MAKKLHMSVASVMSGMSGMSVMSGKSGSSKSDNERFWHKLQVSSQFNHFLEGAFFIMRKLNFPITAVLITALTPVCVAMASDTSSDSIEKGLQAAIEKSDAASVDHQGVSQTEEVNTSGHGGGGGDHGGHGGGGGNNGGHGGGGGGDHGGHGGGGGGDHGGHGGGGGGDHGGHGWHPGHPGHDPYPVHGGNYPWPHWHYPPYPRPIYGGWGWDRIVAVTCTAEDSVGELFSVTQDGYYGYGYQPVLNQVEDAAMDRCFSETGGDPGCFLVGCNPIY